VSANTVSQLGMLTACREYSGLNCMLHVRSLLARNASLLGAKLLTFTN